jgi:hypothetical protein
LHVNSYEYFSAYFCYPNAFKVQGSRAEEENSNTKYNDNDVVGKQIYDNSDDNKEDGKEN